MQFQDSQVAFLVRVVGKRHTERQAPSSCSVQPPYFRNAQTPVCSHLSLCALLSLSLSLTSAICLFFCLSLKTDIDPKSPCASLAKSLNLGTSSSAGVGARAELAEGLAAISGDRGEGAQRGRRCSLSPTVGRDQGETSHCASCRGLGAWALESDLPGDPSSASLPAGGLRK